MLVLFLGIYNKKLDEYRILFDDNSEDYLKLDNFK